MPICRVIGALMLLGALSSTLHAQELSQEKDFNIPPQSLAKAVIQFSDQSGIQVVTSGQDVSKLTTEGVKGRLKIREALKTLLNGTRLSYSVVGSSTVALVSLNSSANSVTSSSESSTPPSSEKTALTEIIVTAQKKSERLQDVPIPVTVLNADKLADTGQVLLKDYYTTVPSLNMTTFAGGVTNLSIRGISPSGGNPTVGVTVDDVPFGGAAAAVGSGELPDLDPGDLDHIEVLRGPQGTLYGADSMGGLLKYVTKDPSVDAFSGRLEAGTSSVYNGAELGYNFRASANIPLGETLAIRASGFTRQDPGYVDNPVIHLNGVNETEARGGHLSALWKPSEVISVKLSALYQNLHSSGLSDVVVQPGLGDLQQNYVPGIEGLRQTIQAYSAILKAKLAGAELTMLSAYNVGVTSIGADFSSVIPGVGGFGPEFGGVSGAPYRADDLTIRKLSQEIRLSTPMGEKVTWLLGAIYTHDSYQELNDIINAENSTTGQIVGVYYHSGYTAKFEEYAAFTDLTYRVTDRFDVQIGGRESKLRLQDSNQVTTGPGAVPFCGQPSPCIVPPEASKGSVFTYLLTPRFMVSPDLMVYARLASGYRPGVPNGVPGVAPFADPDKTKNYEIGVKADFLDHALSVDASLYYIDWKDIQIAELYSQSLGYTGNGSAAKSEGVELSVTSKPLTGLTIGGWVAYSDAELTQAFPINTQAYGVAGDRLPNSSRFSGNFSIQQDFSLWRSATGFVEGQVSYIGDNLGAFTGSPGVPQPRQIFPAYTKTDLRAGVKYAPWTANLYVNNVADVRGEVGGGLAFNPQNAFLYITPRTIGLNISRRF